mmetsp:Transcript_7675/g.12261  ORF Transcript_7675/g.12261 Transcript_7675/m.12261 type:complete len:297 (+) Transcript_7675:1068-1958(+)
MAFVNPPSLKYFNIHGSGVETPRSLSFVSVGQVDRLSLLSGVEPDYDYVSGDGIVSLASAFADGLNATRKWQIPNTLHMDLVTSYRSFGIIRSVVGLACPWEGRWLLSSPTKPKAVFEVGFFQDRHSVQFEFDGVNFTASVDGAWLVGTGLFWEMQSDCLSFNGSLRSSLPARGPTSSEKIFGPWLRGGGQSLEEGTSDMWIGHRVTATECAPGSAIECSVRDGYGTRFCYYGSFSDECRVTSCAAPNYCASESGAPACEVCSAGTSAPPPCNQSLRYYCPAGLCVSDPKECKFSK